jgi:hypothetical protein
VIRSKLTPQALKRNDLTGQADEHRFSGHFFILLSDCGKMLKLQNKKPFPPP